MAWDEINSGGGNFGEEERTFEYAKIGSVFEGAFRGMSPDRKDSKYGPTRYVRLDLSDGRKVIVPARKIVLERFEAANLNDGDLVRLSITEEPSKKPGGRPYGLPKLLVDRQSQAAPAEPQAAAKPVDDEPPF